MPFIKKNAPRRPWQSERKSHERRKKANNTFYNSTKWRKLSKQYKALNPLCILCLKVGEIVAATVTDHIKPINEGGERYDTSNLQALCTKCHAQKSGAEAHKLL